MPIWKPAAIQDRKRIVAYIAQDNLSAAVALGDLVMQKAEWLDANQKAGRAGRMKGTREWVVHPNYVLVYRLIGKLEQVEILRLLHAAQQWPA